MIKKYQKFLESVPSLIDEYRKNFKIEYFIHLLLSDLNSDQKFNKLNIEKKFHELNEISIKIRSTNWAQGGSELNQKHRSLDGKIKNEIENYIKQELIKSDMKFNISGSFNKHFYITLQGTPDQLEDITNQFGMPKKEIFPMKTKI